MSTHKLEELARASRATLASLFAESIIPDPAKLDGWEFRGFNQPRFTRLLGFQKFKKGFFSKAGAYWGYNIPVEQGALERPWRCRPSDESPRRFGFYRVSVVPPGDDSRSVPGSLLLDYSEGKNSLFEGSFLRDYLRQVDADDPDVFIGKAYSALGAKEIAPTFFVLERDRRAPGEIDW